MKSILQSIKPQYCELIANGKKTIEVRKTRPKLQPPFKVYIYCTKGNTHLLLRTYSQGKLTDSDIWQIGNEKVIGEYVCDEIPEYKPITDGRFNGYNIFLHDLIRTCLSDAEISYYGKGKVLYGWHISDLKIYDKPKEISGFYHYCGDNPECKNCPYLYVESNENIGTYEQCCSNNEGCKPLTRPPQSWCYIEEV